MKTVGLVLMLLFSIHWSAYAQGPDTVWSKIHDIFPDIDDGKCVRETIDGGLIITGSCVPDGMVSHIDVLLFQTDSLGNIQWTKTYGKEYIEEGLSLERTSDEGYIIGGRALISSDRSGVRKIGEGGWVQYHSDAWIIKTDSDGDTLWTKTYGGGGNDYCTSIQLTSDGGYILTGTKNAEYSYPHYEINEEYDPDSSQVWLLKTNASGDTLWTKTYRMRSHGNSVIQDYDDGYCIVGWVFPEEHDNQSDVFLIKTDSSGDTLWTKIIGGEDYDIGLCVRPAQDGYVIVGQTKPEGECYDALLIKTDLSGDVVWSKTIGGDRNDSGISLEVTSDGGFFITGITNGAWWVHQGDMWVVKTDSEGNLTWERTYDFRLCDYAWSGIQTSDGGYAVTGMTSFGYDGDLWLAKIGREQTGVQEVPRAISSCILQQNCPNPFNRSTRIFYSIPHSDFVVLEVYDMIGRHIRTLVNEHQNEGTYSVHFDAHVLSSGVYFYALRAGDDLISTKRMVHIRSRY
jgi:hypothetical protein